MSKAPVKVTVTGAAGQIGYALLFRIASGAMLGPDTPGAAEPAGDHPGAARRPRAPRWNWTTARFRCWPASTSPTTRARRSTAPTSRLLVGARPRGPGMERGDLLEANGGIFKPQGAAINAVAADDIRVLVVGNPANTNALIAQSHAPDVPADRFTAMTRLDHNRALTQVAKKLRVAGRRHHQDDHLGQPLGDPVPGPVPRRGQRQAGRRAGRPGVAGERRSSRPWPSAARRSSTPAAPRRPRPPPTPRSTTSTPGCSAPRPATGCRRRSCPTAPTACRRA